MERMEIINSLRSGECDVIVGINLLREGLDLPEVKLVAILDADKEGFLRSEGALIQTIGRAARNAEAKVIMYADKMTASMKRAIDETNRRRAIQQEYNEKHGITPKTIIKNIHQTIGITSKISEEKKLSDKDKKLLITSLEKQLETAVKDLDFELAITLRDKILELKEVPNTYKNVGQKKWKKQSR